MGGHLPQILLYMFVLQLPVVNVQRIDAISLKLQQLDEQFNQFQALTQARMDMLALNPKRKSSLDVLERRVQALSDHYHHMSQDLEHLRLSTEQEIKGLRSWIRKTDKKSKRMEGRLVLLEKNRRENCCHTQELKPDPGQDLLNLTLELQSQEEKLVALQVQRDELIIGLQGLQESLKQQALTVTRLELQISKALQSNRRRKVKGWGRMGEAASSNFTSLDFYRNHKRNQMQREGRRWRILDGGAQPRLEGISQTHTDSHSLVEQFQYHGINKPKVSKAQKPRAHLKNKVQHPNTGPLPPQSQRNPQTQTWPYPTGQTRLQPYVTVTYNHTQIQQPTQVSSYFWKQPNLQNHKHPSWTRSKQVLPHLEPNKDTQSRTMERAPHNQDSSVLHQPMAESYHLRASGWDEGEVKDNDTKAESSWIQNILQLPARHKIPAQPVPKKDAVICNVDSMLLFPSASAENYASFSLSLPDLPELSLCLWLHVEDPHLGTLLSYATENNDNQLVLYGLSSSASSSLFQPSYHSSPPSASSVSLDFVIGDPVYRRLPVSSLMDTHWHHLCVLWSSIQGRFWYYHNRHLISSGSNFRKGWEIPGGGSVVLGQEQDSVGGGFDPAESFVGQMTGFNLWNRVLSFSEVEGLAEGRVVPRGVVLGMKDIKEVHGEVQHVPCDCLEHCF
ncbi:uncharacterized protein LOC121657036 [Melanotaenia boesemani]|uniref:uncharacterized protein LOC121657036 n=1 Tax=Melanotaenia boesemani TaxID=1250792 RepID=UPI001C04B4C6|nr:uncharacterized protein LOC121657036 [Melanotaenia boesemani]